MNSALLLCVLGVMLVTGCRPQDGDPQPENPAREELNIPYGDHPRQRMDVYFPSGYSRSSPVAFLIHGGGFVAGSKEAFSSQARLMRDQGFITINLSYRLVDTTGIFGNPPLRKASNVTIHAQLDDVRKAVAKYRDAAAAWGCGDERMYMAGHSAGAILAMLYTQGDNNSDGHIRASGNWAGVVDFSIPNDSAFAGFPAPQRHQIYELFWRMTGAEPLKKNNLAYMAISPYWVARLNGGRPNISIFPERNGIFGAIGEVEHNLAATRSLHKLLRDKGIAERLSIYSGSDHGFLTPADAWQRCIGETAGFFNAN